MFSMMLCGLSLYVKFALTLVSFWLPCNVSGTYWVIPVPFLCPFVVLTTSGVTGGLHVHSFGVATASHTFCSSHFWNESSLCVFLQKTDCYPQWEQEPPRGWPPLCPISNPSSLHPWTSLFFVCLHFSTQQETIHPRFLFWSLNLFEYVFSSTFKTEMILVTPSAALPSGFLQVFFCRVGNKQIFFCVS